MPDLSFNVQSKLTRQLVLSANKQTAWGTVLPETALTRVQRFDGSAVPDYGNERRSDRGMSGKGFSFATNSQSIMHAVKLMGLKAEATDWIVGFVLSNLMGKVVTTGSAAPYTHAITFDETTRTAIPTTVYVKDTADIAQKLLDMFVTSCTLTIGAKGAVSIDWDMMGTGQKALGALVTAPTIPAENYLMANDAVLNFGPVNGASNFTGRHMSTTMKFDNQGSVQEAPGGGLYGIFGKRSDPKFSIETVIAAKEVDDILTHFLSDDKMSFQFVVNSGANCQMTVAIPAANLTTTKMGFDGDMPVWNIATDETTSYQNGATPPVTVTLVSSQPTWLTAAA